MKKLIIAFLFISQLAYSQSGTVQNESIKQVIDQMYFESDTIETVYNWITENIRYDVSKLNALEKDKGLSKKYKSQKEYNKAMLERVINKKKGVCEDYALLFDAIVKELGFPSVIINGMIKDKKGKIHKDLGHSWNAVKVHGEWRLLDVTWGAGYVSENGKFVKEYTEEWYGVKPEKMLKDHLPFDPLWQLKENPLTYKDFDSDKVISSSQVNYDIAAEINMYLKADTKVRLQAQLDRSDEMGEGFRLIKAWRKRTKENIELGDLIAQPNLLEGAIAKCEGAGKTVEDYSKARNKNFKGRTWTKEHAKTELSKAKSNLETAIASFKSVDVGDNKFNKQLNRNISNAEKMIKFIDSQIDFLNGKADNGTRKSRSRTRRR